MTFKREFKEASGFSRGVLGWVVPLGAVAAAAALYFAVIAAPVGVVSKTLDANNVISNYEWFHDAHGQYKARVAQISAKRRDIIDTRALGGEPGELSRLRVELGAQQQSCRELVGRYNANSTKTNRSIFMGKDAPVSLDAQTCE